MTPERRVQVFAYSAGGLGALSFVWGFLDWVSGVSGYGGGGAEAIVGFALAAGLLAGLDAFENKPVTHMPTVLAVVGLLMVFGEMVSLPSGADTQAGLILQLVTSLVQVAVLVVGWLIITGRMPAARPQVPPQGQWQPPQGQWQPPPQGYQPPPGYQQPPQGYQQPPGPGQPPQA
jgi:hypothetical protein